MISLQEGLTLCCSHSCFFPGQCSFKVLAPLYAVPTSPLESLHPEAKVCGIWNSSFAHSALCCFLMGRRA